jgi:hypothetical protein
MKADTLLQFQSLHRRLDAIDRKLAILTRLETTMSQELVDKITALTDKVSAVETVDASAVTLLQGLSQMVKDLGTDPDPAAVQALADRLDAATASLAAAVTANTPAAPAAS